MLIGYARTSTLEQVAGFEAQVAELMAAGCTRIYKEQVSSVVKHRGQLEAAIDYAREGDVLLVTKLDRLARSMPHLLDIVGRLWAKGAGLRVLSAGIDTTSSTGELILNVLGSIAQWERQMMLERQREGIEKAKGEGKYKGRKPTAMAKVDEVRRLRDEGVRPTEIAKRLGMGRTSVYRCLAGEAETLEA
jgi:DNA invertase Pin-like site-specific DNA recombinase